MPVEDGAYFFWQGEAAQEGDHPPMRCCLVEIVEVVAEGIRAEPLEDARVAAAARLVDRRETAEPLVRDALAVLLVRVVGIAQARGRRLRSAPAQRQSCTPLHPRARA